jgi:hypothetical protein
MKLTVTPDAFPKQWRVEKPQRKLGFLGTVIGIVLALINTFGIYLVTVYYLLPFDLALPGNLLVQFVLFVAGFIVAYYSTILFYEGSHILVGPLVGHTVGMVQVGPLALVRTINGWRVRRVGHEFLLIGGMTYGVPQSGKRLRLRYATYLLSSYALLLLVLAALLKLSSILPVEAIPSWGTVIINLFVITVAYGLWNQLFQIASQLAPTLVDHPGHCNQLRLLTMVAKTVHGVRPKELDPIALQQLVADAKESPIESSANHLAYEAAADRGELTEATNYLSQALHALHRCQVPELRTAILADAAKFEIFYSKDPQRAREWLALCQIKDTSPLAHELYQHYLLAKSAILLAEGHWGDARATALACQAMLQKSFDLGSLPPMQEKLDGILHETTKMLAISPELASQGAAYPKFDPPLQPKTRMIGSLYDWASFAFIYFLLINFNLINGTQSYLYRHWGNQYAAAGQYEQAIVEYTKADHAFPGYAVASMERGIAHSKVGDYDKAVADFTKAIELAWSEEVDQYLWRGDAYYQQGEYELAEADFTHALSLARTQREREWVSETVAWIRNGQRDRDQSAAVD